MLINCGAAINNNNNEPHETKFLNFQNYRQKLKLDEMRYGIIVVGVI